MVAIHNGAQLGEEGEPRRAPRSSFACRRPDLIWVETPFGEPLAKVVVAAARAGALGILDLGTDADRARAALQLITERTDRGFGVRVGDRCPLRPEDLPAAVDTIVAADASIAARWRAGPPGSGPAPRIVVEVRSTDDAGPVLELAVDGLVAQGAESGGRVGPTGAFVLTQQLLALTDLPMIEMPDAASPWSRRLGRFWWQWGQPQHQHFVTCEGMVRALEDLGFEVLSVERGEATFGGELFNAIGLVLQHLTRSPHLPWLPVPSGSHRIKRVALSAAAAPLMAIAKATDEIKDAWLRRPGTTTPGCLPPRGSPDLSARDGKT